MAGQSGSTNRRGEGRKVSGRFIVVDGGEGAGKTTQLAFMHAFLERAGKRVISTREPGGTALGEAIRALLLDHRHGDMALTAETLLVFAARAEHLERVIRPALVAGYWVLCDRFTDATYAYQGGGRGLPSADIAVLETWVQGDLKPDLTLLFDLPVAVGLERAGRRGAADRFERETIEFHNAVRAGFITIARMHPERCVVIDASEGADQVFVNLRKACIARHHAHRLRTLPRKYKCEFHISFLAPSTSGWSL